MSQLPARVRVVEVGARDGLQNEPAPVATTVKVALIERLASTGLAVVEATSFVSPRAVPQLADAEDVLRSLTPRAGTGYPVLTPNMIGYERAAAAGASSVAIFTAASETFNRRNTNASIAESMARYREVTSAAARDGVHVRGYVSTAFGCPFEGPVDPDAVRDVVAALLDLGVADVSIGDTIGVAVPGDIARVCEPLLELADVGELGLHLHDTRGTALSNVWAGLQLGISCFDASVAGLGGCPFAPGATGNLATEDLVWFLHQHGIETGVDLEALIDVASWISAEMERRPAGHVAGSRLWPWPAA